MSKKLKKFFDNLVVDLEDNYDEVNTDHPTCPECGSSMDFYGHDESGDFEYGEGYWKCSCCGFKFTENDLAPSYEKYWKTH